MFCNVGMSAAARSTSCLDSLAGSGLLAQLASLAIHLVCQQATILLSVCRCRQRVAPFEVAAALRLCCVLQIESRRITRRYPGYPFLICSWVGSMVGLVFG